MRASSESTPLLLAPRARTLSPSPTLAINEAIAARRVAGQEVVHLGFGEALFPLHPRLRDALAAHVTSTGYAPVLGITPLREAIARYIERERGISVSAQQIAVGPGSKPLIYALLQVLAGDVLLPTPSWVSYAPHAHLAGKHVIAVPTDPHDHHRLTPRALAGALARARHDGLDPRILVVNSPSNPTGGMFEQASVEALADWARAAGITIVSDEIYAELAHGWRPHVSPARYYPEGTIVTGGLSKAFSAGGWRLGYAALPTGTAGEALLSALRALASEIWSSASTPIQEAAVVAFAPDPDITTYVRRAARLSGYVTSRLHAALTALGVSCPRPAGAFYLYPDFAPFREALQARGVQTGLDLSRLLLDKYGVATLPGEAFGDTPNALRLRLATSMLLADPTATPDERERSLWELLQRVDAVELDEHQASAAPALSVPELDRAVAAFTLFIKSLA